MAKIDKNITFQELISKYPEAVEVLMQKGMHCIGCPASGFETLEQGAEMHGWDIDELIKEMNEKIEKNKTKEDKKKWKIDSMIITRKS